MEKNELDFQENNDNHSLLKDEANTSQIDDQSQIDNSTIQNEKTTNSNIETEDNFQKNQERNSFKRLLYLTFAFGICGVIAGSALTGFVLTKYKPAYIYEQSTYKTIGTVYEENSAIIDAISKTKETVVSVQTTKIEEGFFFQPIPTSGTGSGVIISSDGLVITNNHVIESATQIEVVTFDGEKYAVEVLGKDTVSDIALLRLILPEGKTYPFVNWADSNAIKVGQRVIAIGNPYGLSHSVTTGVISALDRAIEISRGSMIVGLIQTDAAINPGNSGGPLIDLNGNLVGINTAIVQGAEGLGFSISSNVARKVMEDILIFGEAVWPWIGISGQTVNDDLSRSENLQSNYGVIIRQVQSNTPAARVGLKLGDIIISINDRRVVNMNSLTSIIRSYRVGDEIEIEVVRNNGEKSKIKITLEKRPL